MSKLHILYIEENEKNIDLVAECLTVPPIQLTVVDNAAKSISYVQQLEPDIILLNINLKSVNGFFVLRALKINFITQHIPIILISANHSVARGVTRGRFGANSFIGEPISQQQLTGAINLFAVTS